jgi:methyl-accepting chemotaxis protein
MTGGAKNSVLNAQDRIDELLAGQNGLNDAVETALNDLKSQLDALDLAGDTDVQALTDKINLLNDIVSKDGVANDLFDALKILGDAWNDAGDMTVSVEVDFNSATGELAVDLTSFGFAESSIVCSYSNIYKSLHFIKLFSITCIFFLILFYSFLKS